ncbi:MAG: P-loop NTPase fold protein [Cyclobacteriaceae bacterium]
MSEKPSIDIQSPSTDFQDHLNLPDNQRIFFSGLFGIGKTYFLDKFFKEREDKYAVIHLYPVNYSVAQNEDIFELIKFDILYQLMVDFSEENLFDNPKISTSIQACFYLQNSANAVLKPLLDGFRKVSDKVDGLFKVAESIEKLGAINIEAFDEFKKENSSKLPTITEYLKGQIKTIGSIYERDYYTILIRELIAELTEKKKTVLIIDDLDRVDPEHIFRILNVFAAHFDISETENKFGFSKVIVVADHKNVQSIFRYKFGVDADFNGYVDKFYSVKPFRFDNRSAVNNWVSENFKFRSSDNKFLSTILLGLISGSFISLRQLFKFNFDLNLQSELEKTSDYFLSAHAKILSDIFGDNSLLIDLIGKIDKSFPRNWQGFRDLKKVDHWCRMYVFTPLVAAYGDLPPDLFAPEQEVNIVVEGEELSLKRDDMKADIFYLQDPLIEELDFWKLTSKAFEFLLKK